MWHKGGKKVGSSEAESEVLPIWKRGAQEVEVPTKKREKEGRSGTIARGVE